MNIYSLSMQIFSKTQVNEIAFAIKNGKAAVLPTDTVWGLAALDERIIYQIKKRAPEKKVIKFIDSIEALGMPSFLSDVIQKYWPGGLSVIWKGISYRIPKCKYIQEIVKITGPLFQSSANISGDQPITDVAQIPQIFQEHLKDIVIVDNKPKEEISNKPSTIIDLDKLIVVRNGDIDGQKIINEIKQRKEKQ